MNYENIVPIADRVVVKQDSAESMTKGGIAIPDKVKESPRFGTVVAVGPGVLRPFPGQQPLMHTGRDGLPVCDDRYPMQCKVGDRVVLPPQGDRLWLDPADQESMVVICSEQQLVAILK